MPDLDSEFHAVVCMKVTPKPEEIRVDPQTRALARIDVRSEINPPDMNALEMALSLKDQLGGRVSILSMGPHFFAPYLQAALAMGADHIYLLSDRAFAGADTLATTYTLARGIQQLGDVDIIFCGEESSDGATGQVPPGLAEWLEASQITLVGAVEVDLAERLARGKREFMGGYELLEVPLPCVISVKTASNEPRFMDYRIKPWAFEQERVTIWDRNDLAVEPDYIGLAGSPTRVSALEQAPSRSRKRTFLSGSTEDVARQLAALLLQGQL